uniref:Uncharacterized protein n=1 Tax=Anguilla anguilla TaxID=7936 RepID=A0A0E9TDP9_ANGAN
MKWLPPPHVCASLACGLWCEKKELATSHTSKKSACVPICFPESAAYQGCK